MKSRCTLLPVALSLFLAQGLIAQFIRIPPGHSALLPEKEGMRLTNQCSRRGVVGVEATWVPTELQLVEMELELAKFLQSNHPRISKSVNRLYLQYVGLIVGSRKIIYINAFDEFQVNPPFIEEPVDWRKVAMKFCDGGRTFWGLEYDPLTKSFSNMAFNGKA
jgi:hypothetical protein